MRQLVVVVATVLLGAMGLAACNPGASSASVSYGNGYSIGQSLAADAGRLGATHAQATEACARQWRDSADVSDQASAWIRGCTAGYLDVASTVSSVVP